MQVLVPVVLVPNTWYLFKSKTVTWMSNHSVELAADASRPESRNASVEMSQRGPSLELSWHAEHAPSIERSESDEICRTDSECPFAGFGTVHPLVFQIWRR